MIVALISKMRILFLSNYYPPFSRGGYEQWCQEVATELVRRGHLVSVVTSPAPDRVSAARDGEAGAQRWLNLEVEGGLLRTSARLIHGRERSERENLCRLRRLVTDFAPDVAMIWGMWNVPRSVPALVERLLPGRVAYYLCDYWPSLPNAYVQQWQNGAARALASLPKRLLGKLFLPGLLREPAIPLRLEHPLCVSGAVREILVRSGVSAAHARVIQGGIQVDDFKPRALEAWERQDGALKLLYAGRLTPEKGVHTAIRALALVSPRADRPVTLDLVGHGDRRYVDGLKRLVDRGELEGRVTFRPGVARAEMPGLLARYDALVFPSEWEEPFARTVIEAMAVGLVVVGTTTGGTVDVLVEGETGLTFAAGDRGALAAQIQRLRDDRALGKRLARSARKRVEESYTFGRMVDELEAYLHALGAGNALIPYPFPQCAGEGSQ